MVFTKKMSIEYAQIEMRKKIQTFHYKNINYMQKTIVSENRDKNLQRI
jgi:hypothetical protein